MTDLFGNNELFDTGDKKEEVNPELTPLAERVRAESVEDFLGQEHIMGENGIVSSFVKNKTLFSLILWGPPGTGKTTLARIIAKQSGYKFYSVNAVSSSVKELREIISIAERLKRKGQGTVLFIDEIHRFNKAQQDALLKSVEDGTLTLIGATTENPSFEVNSALLSRSRVLTLKSLDNNSLLRILDKALTEDVMLKDYNIDINDTTKAVLIETSGGDARKLLNTLEISVKITDGDKKIITPATIKRALLSNIGKYDKKGEMHYDIISAFIKSVRGSDPDAAVYYLARMIDAGEDPLFIARRLIILASEDIGNASPNGLVLATSGFDAVHKIGMPEAGLILSQVTTYLASQPKSNASTVAISKAKKIVEKTKDSPKVPLHLRNAPTDLMKDLGYSKGYKYAHDYKNNFIEDTFLPDEIKNEQFYFPTENGLEKNIKNHLKSLWKNKKNYL